MRSVVFSRNYILVFLKVYCAVTVGCCLYTVLPAEVKVKANPRFILKRTLSAWCVTSLDLWGVFGTVSTIFKHPF